MCHLSITPTATATDPSSANSPIIHSRLAHSLSGSTPSVREDTQSGLVTRYRGCVTEITSWRAGETRWATMINRRNLLLSLLFPKVCSVNL